MTMKPDARLNLSWILCLAAAWFGMAGNARAALPTISTVNTLTGGNEDTATDISFTELRNAADEADSDSGSTVNFRIVALSSGTLSVTPPFDFTAGSVQWTPPANANGVLDAFTIRALSAGELSTNTVQVRVQVTAVNDKPAIAGNILASIGDNADGETATRFLNGLTITDVEGDNVTVIVRVPKAAEDFANLDLPQATVSESGNDFVYSYAATSAASATANLALARFDPQPNLIPTGGSQTFNIRVEVNDGSGGQPTTKSGNLTINAEDDAPQVSLSFNPPAVPDDAQSQPFRITLVDGDAQPATTFTLTLTEVVPAGESAKGTLTLPSGGLTGTIPQLQSAMTAVRYLPNPISGSSLQVTFTCSVSGGNTATAVLTISSNNDPPDISGITTATIQTNDDPVTAAVKPFASVIISDPDLNQQLTATITPDNADKGTVTSAALNGTASELTQILRNATFKPTANRLPVGQTETTTLTLSVNDGQASRNNSQTRVASLSVNGAPAMTLPALPVAVDGESSGTPFASVGLSDDDASVTVTITLDNNAKGTLTGSFAPQPAGSGIYVFTGTPAAAEAALKALVYTLNPAFTFPPSEPGKTTFTIEVVDSLQNRTTVQVPVILRSAARNFLVTLREDDARLRPGSLRHAVTNAKNNDVITFDFATYPAVLRLDPALEEIVITRNLRIKGPGPDLLTISGDRNGDGVADMQLFKVQAAVVMEGLTLADGTASTGGAVHVNRNLTLTEGEPGSLLLRHCAVVNCTASQWGGAIDVEEGALTLESCLLRNNVTDASSGLGGGAVSLYTTKACTFTATTFSGNRQQTASGFGGGAIYAENFDPQIIFPVTLAHCTFTGNVDAAGQGTSVHANVFNCRVTARGTIFADSAQRNLHVAGGGQILSAGRNVSNDAARTTLIQGGLPQSVSLLNHATDKVSTDPLLQPLAPAIGGTETHALSPGSPAIGAVAALEAPDQRGVHRDATPDSGAVEFNVTKRILINEVHTPDAVGANSFVEFYVPRDSTPVDVSGLTLWVDGLKRHTFDAGTALIQPGFGIIAAEATFAVTGTPVVPVPGKFWPTTATDHQRSLFELRGPGDFGLVLTGAGLVNVFANPANLPLNLSFPNNSLTLDPQFRGHAYVPHSTGLSGLATSPGADSANTPFGSRNAFPAATSDTFVVHEDDLVTLPVLFNDNDADGLDTKVLVDVSRLRSATPPAAPVGDDATATSDRGAAVSIAPSSAPLRGTALLYDPRTALNSLPVGLSAQDTFFYTIVDIGGGPITAYAASGVTTQITSPGHRLINNDSISISEAGTAAYNGTFLVTKINDDAFTIRKTNDDAVAFVNDPAVKGAWKTTGTRQPTQRSETGVAVTVLGRNDAPTPAADTVATNEEQILRIMGDPDLIATVPAFDTDPNYPAPRAFAATAVLSNDTDPDTDDNTFRKLHIVGVTQAKAVTNYSGTAGEAPVTVTIAGHGLATGDSVLISGYGGHSSYNATHVATVVDADTFTIPVAFVENNAQKGLVGVLTDEGRLSTTSALGAAVTLEIRTSRAETNIVYNPRASATLNALSLNEPTEDSFYYVAEDSHGAKGLARIRVNVTGVNDTPLPQNDPGSVSGLEELVTGGQTLRDVLTGAKVLYSIPSGAVNRGTVTLRTGGSDYVLTGVPRTFEDVTLNIPAMELLANDSDVDHLDVLQVTLAGGQNVSREGAAVSLADGGATIVYNPGVSARLHALAREERIMDSIALNIADGTTSVTAILAIEVTGRNDKPTALADSATIPEDQLLTLAPPGVLANDSDPDQDTRLPDNRKVLIPASAVTTNVYGARIDATVAAASGDIQSFAADAGNSALTKVNAAAHGLSTGEEIRIGGTAVDAYNGQFRITRVDDDSFTIPVPSAAGADSAGAGAWESLRSSVTYDPRGSVFNGSPVGTVFTLDGLAEGQTFTDSWTYTMFDGSMVFANDDTFRVAADSSGVVLDVSVNDVNLSGLTGALTIVDIGNPSALGTVEEGENGTVVYTPETSFVGDEYFTYTVMDAQGNVDSALVQVRVTVEQLNGNLQANPDAFTVAKGQSPLLSVLANDDLIPVSGASIGITQITAAPSAGGSAVIEGAGIRYTPAVSNPQDAYTETFAYEISGGGTARAVASVTIQVVNRAGTLPLRPDTVSVAAGSAGNVLNVLANDNILPGSGLGLVITAATAPAGGAVSLSADKKQLFFTPNDGFIGTTSFSYSASDELGGTGTASVTVIVGGLTTNNDFFAVSSGTATPVTLDVLANDRVLGTPGNISLKAAAAVVTPIGTLGAVSSGAQTLTFTPVTGQTGERTFTYTIEDGTGREASGSLTVFVSGPGLRANSDFFTIQAGAADSELPVLLNDTEIPDSGLPRAIVSIGTGANGPDQGGSAVPNLAGDRIIYNPAQGFTGEERFTYTVSNGDISAVAQVIVRISDGALLANDDAFSIYKGSSNQRLEVLANDRFIPSTGQTLTITGIGIVQNAPGQEGTVVVANDASALIYTPNPNATAFPYTESFTYEITDGTARRTQATVRIEVLDRTGAREVETNDDAFTVLAGGRNILLAVLANDDVRPATAQGWIITDPGTPSQGGTVIVAGPGIEYTPRLGFVGTETFAYSVSDGLGGTGSATVTVKVGDISVSDDHFTVLSGSGDTLLDVLANDGKLPDGFPDRTGLPGLDGFTLAAAPPLTPGNGGTAVVSGDQIVYRPAANFTGEETFTYYVRDDSGVTFPGKVTVNVAPAGSDRASAVLTVTVTGVNDTPLFVNPAVTATNDRTALHPFANATVLDVDDQQRQRVTVRVTWPEGQGVLSGGFTVVSPGVIEFSGRPSEVTSALRGLVFTPVNNRIPVGTTEQTAFGVTLDDGFVSAPVVIGGNSTSVTPVNDPPVLTGTVAGQMLQKAFTLQPFIGTNITDVDNLAAQTLQVSVRIDNAIKGTLTGSFVETPAGSGNYTFTGTPAAAAAALRALVFTPTPGGRVTPAQSETSAFTITVSDSFAAPVVDAVTTVTVVHGEQDVILPLGPGGADISQNGAEFSTGLSLSGDTLVVGAPRRDTSEGSDSGAAYVYERNAGTGLPWGQVASLLPAELNPSDFFGQSVSIDADLIAIGTPYAEYSGLPLNSGAVFLFRRDPANRNAWLPLERLLPPAGSTGPNDNFGWSVAVQGTTLLVAAPRSTVGGEPLAGRIYVYERNQAGPDGFTPVQTLTAADARNGLQFGYSIALDAHTAVFGAPGAGRSQAAADLELGAAYVFRRPAAGGTWSQSAKLSAFNDADARAGDHLGHSVDIDRDTIIAGAPQFDPVVAGNRRTDGGAVFLFDRDPANPDAWTQASKAVSPDGLQGDYYGYAVALAGDLAFIGAPKDSAASSTNGYVHLRRRHSGGISAWGVADRFVDGPETGFDRFGQAVALDGFTGAAGSTADAQTTGHARVYQFNFAQGPRFAAPLADRFAPESQAFSYQIPGDSFGDPEFGQALTYAALQENGTPLPAGGWLSFNASTRTFLGTPVPGNNADYRLVVRATNQLGATVTSNAFSVTVILDAPGTLQRLYNNWAAGKFSQATLTDPALENTVWGMHANPDGDSAVNLIEMIYGGLPEAREPSPLVVVKNADATVSVTFPRHPDVPLEFIHVEWSDAMTSWQRSSVGYVTFTGQDGHQYVTATVYPDAPRRAIYIRIAGGM
jgi:VCBS repeat-containing protein